MKTHNSELGMVGDHDHITKSYYYMIFHIISIPSISVQEQICGKPHHVRLGFRKDQM